MADRRDPCTLVDIEADIPLLGQPRLTRMQTHPHPDRAARERALSFLGSPYRIRSTTEGDEERVTLRIDLDAIVRRERCT
jgi:hypothetical protein